MTFLTRKGEIQIGIYAKELPDVCRAFLEKCASKQYIGLRFGVVKDKVLQTVLPENDGGKIKPQFHSRLSFASRGAVGLMACEDGATLDGLFITLEPANEFNGSYVLLGKVVGTSIYSVVDIADGEKSGDELVDAIEVTNVQIDVPYFQDLKVDNGDVQPKQETQQPKRRKKAVKLDYGDDDDEDGKVGEVFKIRAAHDTIGGGAVNAAEKVSGMEASDVPSKTEKNSEREGQGPNKVHRARQDQEPVAAENNEDSAGSGSKEGGSDGTHSSADLNAENALSSDKEQSRSLETTIEKQDTQDPSAADEGKEEPRKDAESLGSSSSDKQPPATEEPGRVPLVDEAVKPAPAAKLAAAAKPVEYDAVLDIEDNVTKAQLLMHRFVPKAM